MMIEHGTVIGVVAMATDGSADPTLWYVTRAAALAAYITMTIGILLGLVRTAIRRSGDGIPGYSMSFISSSNCSPASSS